MSNILIEYLPYSNWFNFSYVKLSPEIRDLGDINIFISRFQITIWTRKPYYKKSLIRLNKIMAASDENKDR